MLLLCLFVIDKIELYMWMIERVPKSVARSEYVTNANIDTWPLLSTHISAVM